MFLRRRTIAIVALAAGVLFAADSSAQKFDRTKSKSDASRITRVFVLDTMDTREAVTLLRSEAKARRVVEIRDLRTVVVTETAEVVQRSESLLREKKALASASTPHDPISVENTLKAPVQTRVFQIEGVDTYAVVTVLRSVYGIRDVKAKDDGENVTVTSKSTKLDAAEALLRDLQVLVKATVPEATPETVTGYARPFSRN